MRTVVVIPARYSSSRYPGKPLVELLGKPMIIWVAELASKAVSKENVYVATDDHKISSIVERWGFQTVLTSSECLTGTDRLAEASKKIYADVYINVQGDEPLVCPEDIKNIAEYKKSNMGIIVNGFCYLNKFEDPNSVNIPKVIMNETNRLVYMSRAALPGFKETKNAPENFKKQVCIYAFTSTELKMFSDFGRKSELEKSEDIELLRFLEMDKDIHMIETRSGSLAVDAPEDVEAVEAEMLARGFIKTNAH